MNKNIIIYSTLTVDDSLFPSLRNKEQGTCSTISAEKVKGLDRDLFNNMGSKV